MHRKIATGPAEQHVHRDVMSIHYKVYCSGSRCLQKVRNTVKVTQAYTPLVDILIQNVHHHDQHTSPNFSGDMGGSDHYP